MSREVVEVKEETFVPKTEPASTVNSQRQAMVEAEAVLTQRAKERKGRKTKSLGSLQEADANMDRKFLKHVNRNVEAANRRSNGLPGDGTM